MTKLALKRAFDSLAFECNAVFHCFLQPQAMATPLNKTQYTETERHVRKSQAWSASVKVASPSPNSGQRYSAWPVVQKLLRAAPPAFVGFRGYIIERCLW